MERDNIGPSGDELFENDVEDLFAEDEATQSDSGGQEVVAELQQEFGFEIDEFDNEGSSELCEHDDRRETKQIQIQAGGQLMGVGLQGGSTKLVAACPVCANSWPMEHQSDSGLFEGGSPW